MYCPFDGDGREENVLYQTNVASKIETQLRKYLDGSNWKKIKEWYTNYFIEFKKEIYKNKMVFSKYMKNKIRLKIPIIEWTVIKSSREIEKEFSI